MIFGLGYAPVSDVSCTIRVSMLTSSYNISAFSAKECSDAKPLVGCGYPSLSDGQNLSGQRELRKKPKQLSQGALESMASKITDDVDKL